LSNNTSGISSSKVKVVINSDPEAPFFKVADYGIVGDAFDVAPRLLEKFKSLKHSNHNSINLLKITA
jgi:electron transfer flavoprotein alpha subunit